ncbi:hypothetical protein JCM19000A_24500 [Silvimonas sp. JCM 19000]
MVTLVIGLIMSLVIYNVIKINEGRKRTIMSVSDMDQAGTYAMYQLDQYIRSAGAGFSGNRSALYGCKLNVSVNGNQLLPPTSTYAIPSVFSTMATAISTFRLAPVLIYRGTSSDQLMIMSGNNGMGEFQSVISTSPTATNLVVDNTASYNPGDVLLITNPSSSFTTCLMSQVATTLASGASQNLPLGNDSSSRGYYTAAGANITVANTPIPGMVIGLGNVGRSNPPRFTLLGVDNTSGANSLVAYDLLQTNLAAGNRTTQEPPLALADGVVEMHAAYGLDDGSGGITWVAPTGTYAAATMMNGSSTDLLKVKAVRIGLLIRTSLPEKTIDNAKGVGVSATVSSGSVTMFSDLTPKGSPTPTFTRALTTDEQNYRFRVFETTIPVRNGLIGANLPNFGSGS